MILLEKFDRVEWTLSIGQTGSDACTGDGGGPLLCPLSSDPAKLVQAGIVINLKTIINIITNHKIVVI